MARLPLEGLLTSSARPADGQDEEAERLLILASDDRHLIKSHRCCGGCGVGWDLEVGGRDCVPMLMEADQTAD